MAKRIQKHKEEAPQRESDVAEDAIVANTEKGDKLKAEMDAVLEEIDLVLEKNAAEFVQSFVQKGGQ